MKRKWPYAGLVPRGTPSPPLWERESSLLSLVDLGATWILSLLSTNGESTLTPGSIWGSTLLSFSPRYVLSRVTASWSGFSCVWGLRWVCRKKGRERVQKGVAASPARGMSHPCDFMVVQELGNIWPGWRGLGKGVFTPNRFLSPPWGKNKCLEIWRSWRTLIASSEISGVLFTKHQWPGGGIGLKTSED